MQREPEREPEIRRHIALVKISIGRASPGGDTLCEMPGSPPPSGKSKKGDQRSIPNLICLGRYSFWTQNLAEDRILP